MREKLIAQIVDRMVQNGFVPGTEQYDICRRALEYLDFSYKRSEELEAGTTVDCSTLVSQAHWEGAAIGIPFVAENQRKAKSGRTIASLDDMEPADVLIKYRSLEESPDKTWNHVALYLGRDSESHQWLLESRSRGGVRLSEVEEFDASGGIKRFTLTREKFDSLQAQSAIALTPLVPKFGRLGVRQYRKSGAERLVHKGIDIYAQKGTKVYATVDGTVSLIKNQVELSRGVEIVSQNMTVRYVMLEGLAVKTGEVVKVGSFLGYVAYPSKESDIVYSSAKENPAHLHLEVEVPLLANLGPRSQAVVDNNQYFNHLYLSKIGVLRLPFIDEAGEQRQEESVSFQMDDLRSTRAITPS